MEQRCTKCGETKPVEEFRWKNKSKGIRACWCKTCFALHEKSRYDSDKKFRERKYGLHVQRTIRNARYIWEFLENHPCIDCGEDDPIVLEFDHRGDKEKSVCDLVRLGYSIDVIQQEIDKCDIRCANCHRRKTAKDFEWYKWRNVAE
ncbi:MAG: hypothetical protein R3220_09140 [Balneolaceae bacterium]|nr:hypothetical protein [Balneolaceae bacterium]